MKRYWKVGDLAKLTGRTLRFYEQIGLLSPSAARYRDTGYTTTRIYRDSIELYR